MTTAYHEIAQRHIAIRNETDPVRRRRDIDDLWAPEGRSVDPLTVAEGHQVSGFLDAQS
ncbi:hypothetical protein [Micromonospora tarensis]|uniref:Uncharacterized protein n=1 Tax=Micromonospora tarensis TaxID=2806100 RepID=A0ABS1YH81_9ACTN|nr:hypothetical protein [Micromonospora tarensis]MBM0276673.1 hypothetical protein [Micromonospora tarensis]